MIELLKQINMKEEQVGRSKCIFESVIIKHK